MDQGPVSHQTIDPSAFSFLPQHTPTHKKGPRRDISRRALLHFQVSWPSSYCWGVVVCGVVEGEVVVDGEVVEDGLELPVLLEPVPVPLVLDPEP